MTGGDSLLQRCRDCWSVLYPRREVCCQCLSGELADLDAEGARATLITLTTLHGTHESALRPFLPLRIGTVALENGPKLIVYVAPRIRVGDPVILSVVDDPDGIPVMIAAAEALAAKRLAEALDQGADG